MIQVLRTFEHGSLPRDTETTEVDSAGRLANRPPDAALNPVDAAFLGVEDRLRVAMDQRDSLVEQIKALEGQRATLERHLKRAVTYWAQKWMSARRTIKLLMVIGGSVLAVETLALAGLIWRMVAK